MTGRSLPFDRAAGFYDATRGFPPGVERTFAERLAAVAGLTARSRVLEIGVGTGRVALPLSRFTGRYVGVDLSRPMLAVLREKWKDEPVAIVQGDMTHLPLGDDRFDLAICVHVFHLVSAWRRVIAELGRVVRAGGAVLTVGDDLPRCGGITQRWNELRIARGVPHATSLPGVRDAAQIATALAEEGFVERTSGVAVEWARTFTPNEILVSYEDRVWGSLWSIPEPTFLALIADLRQWIAATFPDPDVPLQEAAHSSYTLFRRPASSPASA